MLKAANSQTRRKALKMVGVEEFKKTTNVSHETFRLYEKWYGLLTHWNKTINLVSPNTISNYWLRHALDSYQLCSFLPEQKTSILDLGSGAGFPGLALAIRLKEQSLGSKVILVESNGKKCNFLRTVIRGLDLPAQAVQARVEDYAKEQPQKFNVITARAFAPLPKLMHYSLPFWGGDKYLQTLGVFPKGARWRDEISEAQKQWSFEYEAVTSQTDSQAQILLVKNLKPISTVKERVNEH